MRRLVWIPAAGRKAGANRVIRGGSWNDNARNVRSAYRNGNHPGNRNDKLGFRCARAHDRTGPSGLEQAGRLAIAPPMAKPQAAGVAVGCGGAGPNPRRPADGCCAGTRRR